MTEYQGGGICIHSLLFQHFLVVHHMLEFGLGGGMLGSFTRLIFGRGTRG